MPDDRRTSGAAVGHQRRMSGNARQAAQSSPKRCPPTSRVSARARSPRDIRERDGLEVTSDPPWSLVERGWRCIGCRLDDLAHVTEKKVAAGCGVRPVEVGVVMMHLVVAQLLELNSSRMRCHAWMRVATSRDAIMRSKRRASTLRILPRSGKESLVSAVAGLLADPPGNRPRPGTARIGGIALRESASCGNEAIHAPLRRGHSRAFLAARARRRPSITFWMTTGDLGISLQPSAACPRSAFEGWRTSELELVSGLRAATWDRAA